MILIPLSIEKCTFACWFGATSIPSDFLYPQKSRTCFDIYLITVFTKPALCKLLTCYVQNFTLIFLSISHLPKESDQTWSPSWYSVTSISFMVTSCKPQAQPQSWKATHCQLYATAYSTYLQLPSICSLRLYHTVVTRDSYTNNKQTSKTNSVALSPQANYTDWLTATCRRNLVSTFVDRGVLRGQCGGSPMVVNLSFLDWSHY
jgi:hypothetical protein